MSRPGIFGVGLAQVEGPLSLDGDFRGTFGRTFEGPLGRCSGEAPPGNIRGTSGDDPLLETCLLVVFWCWPDPDPLFETSFLRTFDCLPNPPFQVGMVFRWFCGPPFAAVQERVTQITVVSGVWGRSGEDDPGLSSLNRNLDETRVLYAGIGMALFLDLILSRCSWVGLAPKEFMKNTTFHFSQILKKIDPILSPMPKCTTINLGIATALFFRCHFVSGFMGLIHTRKYTTFHLFTNS